MIPARLEVGLRFGKAPADAKCAYPIPVSPERDSDTDTTPITFYLALKFLLQGHPDKLGLLYSDFRFSFLGP